MAFYLAGALRTRLGVDAARFDPRDLLDLVALGTVADLVPLVDENRILVAAGLRIASARKRPGLRVLAALAGIEADDAITAEHVSFRLAPRLNAAGRLGEAQLALDLLLAPDDAIADRLAAELDERNRQRQMIQEQVWTEALGACELHETDAALVVGAEGWHPGVVGIVAAKLVEQVRAAGDRDRLRIGAGARIGAHRAGVQPLRSAGGVCAAPVALRWSRRGRRHEPGHRSPRCVPARVRARGGAAPRERDATTAGRRRGRRAP